MHFHPIPAFRHCLSDEDSAEIGSGEGKKAPDQLTNGESTKDRHQIGHKLTTIPKPEAFLAATRNKTF